MRLRKEFAMKKLRYKLAYIWKMLTLPTGTKFELDWGKPTQRCVNRFEYICATLKVLR